MKTNFKIILLLLSILHLTGLKAQVWERSFGTTGSAPGQFKGPNGIVTTRDYVYVADNGNNKIVKYTVSGTLVKEWGGYGTADGKFQSLGGIALDTLENIYVADYGNNRIQKFDKNGKFLKQIGYYGTGNGQLNRPRAVAVDDKYNIYVADANNRRIVVFKSDGTFLRTWGSPGTLDHQLGYPVGILLQKDINYKTVVYVVDQSNNRIMKYSEYGNFLSKFGSFGTTGGLLFDPWCITKDWNGDLYVSASGNNCIKKYNKDGVFVKQIGTYGSANGQFSYPTGVFLGYEFGNTKLYVSDFNNNRVQKLALPNYINRREGENSEEIEVSTNSVQLYPNPSQGGFQISVPKVNGFEFEVRDAFGATLIKQTVSGSEYSAEAGTLSTGMYFVYITAEGVKETMKLQIVK